MSKIHFDVDAYTARLIGRENVSRLEGAVSELVKNTYDADASCCVLYYEQSTQTLYLADNGCGMTNEQKSHILDMYRSDPDWIASGYGLGLGMMIVYAAAKAHNGTLLINGNDPHGCKITLTLTIEKGDSMVRQKPVNIIIDPLGGADALLLELSDVLPSNEFI